MNWQKQIGRILVLALLAAVVTIDHAAGFDHNLPDRINYHEYKQGLDLEIEIHKAAVAAANEANLVWKKAEEARVKFESEKAALEKLASEKRALAVAKENEATARNALRASKEDELRKNTAGLNRLEETIKTHREKEAEQQADVERQAAVVDRAESDCVKANKRHADRVALRSKIDAEQTAIKRSIATASEAATESTDEVDRLKQEIVDLKIEADRLAQIREPVISVMQNITAQEFYLEDNQQGYLTSKAEEQRLSNELSAAEISVRRAQNSLRAMRAASNPEKQASVMTKRQLELAETILSEADSRVRILKDELAAAQIASAGYLQQIEELRQSVHFASEGAWNLIAGVGYRGWSYGSLSDAVERLDARLVTLKFRTDFSTAEVQRHRKSLESKLRQIEAWNKELKMNVVPAHQAARRGENAAQRESKSAEQVKNKELAALTKLIERQRQLVNERTQWQADVHQLAQANAVLPADIHVLAVEIGKLDQEAIHLQSEAAAYDSNAAEVAKRIARARIVEESKKESFDELDLTRGRQEASIKNTRRAYETRLSRYNSERGLAVASAKRLGAEHGAEAGKQAGMRAGRDAGSRKGIADGAEDGAEAGKTREYEAGLTVGRANGEMQGQADGKLAGEEAGRLAGQKEGTLQGGKAGYEAGHDEGYESAHNSDCSQATVKDEFYQAGVEVGLPLGMQDAIRSAKKDDFPTGYEQAKAALMQTDSNLPQVVVNNSAQSKTTAWTHDSQPIDREYDETSRDEAVDSHSKQRNYCNRYLPENPDVPSIDQGAGIATTHLDYEQFRELYASTYRYEYVVAYEAAYKKSYLDEFKLAYKSSESCEAAYKDALDLRYQASYDAGVEIGYQGEYKRWKQQWQERYSEHEGDHADAYKIAFREAYDLAYGEYYLSGKAAGEMAWCVEGLKSHEANTVASGAVSGRELAKVDQREEQRRYWHQEGKNKFLSDLVRQAWPVAISAALVTERGDAIDTARDLWSGSKVKLQVVVRNWGGREAAAGQLKVEIEAIQRAAGAPAEPIALKALAAKKDTKYINVADLYVIGGHESNDRNHDRYGVFHVKVKVLNGTNVIGAFEFRRRVTESLQLANQCRFKTSSGLFQRFDVGDYNQGQIAYENRSPLNFEDPMLKVEEIKAQVGEQEWESEEGWKVVDHDGNSIFSLTNLPPKAQTGAVKFYTFHAEDPHPTKGKKLYTFNIYNRDGFLIHSQNWQVVVDALLDPI